MQTDRPKKRAANFLLKRMAFIPLGVIAAGATWYAQGTPAWAEWYAQAVYPWLSSVVGFLPSLVEFSVAEWFVVAFLLFSLGYVGFYVRAIVKNKGERGMTAYRGAMGALAICCVMYFAFTALCGLNYYRYTFSSYTGYETEQPDATPEQRQEELVRLCASLASGLSETREQLGDAADLYDAEPGAFERYAERSVAALQTLAERYPVLERPLYSRPKPVLASSLMSDANIAGMFFPFTVESNVNVDGPFFTMPSTMAHELAHQCGFMREDEADFIAYLACKSADDELMRYSGLLLAYDRSLSALRKTDADAARAIAEGLSPAVQRDLVQRAEFWARHEGAISDASTVANDAYLKANRQADGVQSYGRMVELLLAEQRAETK